MRNLFYSATNLLRIPRCVLFSSIGCLCLMSGVITSGCSNSNDDYVAFATLNGSVTDYVTGVPLENASVVLSPSNQTKQTGADGVFVFDGLEAKQYTITVQKAGYQPNRKVVTAISGESVDVKIQLTQIPE